MKNILIHCLLLLTIFLGGCQSEQSQKTVAQKEEAKPVARVIPPAVDSLLLRFEGEISRFDSIDRQDGLTKNGILFTGSSSIRMWTSLAEDMKGLPTLNRGFGGATIPEVLHYMDRYLFGHEPQVIVFYCGENDISEGADPATVLRSFQTFVEKVEAKLPKTKMVFVTMKPSIARWNLWEKYQAGNTMIQQFINKKENITYFDCSLSMLTSDGEVRKDIFIEDGLHMNAKGYAGWTAQLKPVLEKLYQR